MSAYIYTCLYLHLCVYEASTARKLIRQAPASIADFNKRCQKCVANEACDALDKLQAFAEGEAASNGQSLGAGFVAGVASSSAGPASLAGGSSGLSRTPVADAPAVGSSRSSSSSSSASSSDE